MNSSSIIRHASNGLKHKSVGDYLKMRFAKAAPAASRIVKMAGKSKLSAFAPLGGLAVGHVASRALIRKSDSTTDAKRRRSNSRDAGVLTGLAYHTKSPLIGALAAHSATKAVFKRSSLKTSNGTTASGPNMSMSHTLELAAFASMPRKKAPTIGQRVDGGVRRAGSLAKGVGQGVASIGLAHAGGHIAGSALKKGAARLPLAATGLGLGAAAYHLAKRSVANGKAAISASNELSLSELSRTKGPTLARAIGAHGIGGGIGFLAGRGIRKLRAGAKPKLPKSTAIKSPMAMSNDYTPRQRADMCLSFDREELKLALCK